ncbi:hypothetical protein [Sphingopyxis sp.]|uniref:hypothetical protein n=1 Tax=Sphingopyxis sp. TaxID=1908224 RepID=UPI001D5BB473|nr:hypothetical protein [Sphingopyxis sp.]MBW8297017.1 hypothetical protein [Sphingopyxis sp.]
MKPTHPLPVHHSWPLYERERFFELGQLHGADTLDAVADMADLDTHGRSVRAQAGWWECDLANNNQLSWSSEVYDIFSLPRGAAVTREETVALYQEGSRAAMEKLRAYAIKHRRGFTLDVEIRPASEAPRWMRLIAEPLCVDDKIVKLQGLKFIVPERE